MLSGLWLVMFLRCRPAAALAPRAGARHYVLHALHNIPSASEAERREKLAYLKEGGGSRCRLAHPTDPVACRPVGLRHEPPADVEAQQKGDSSPLVCYFFPSAYGFSRS